MTLNKKHLFYLLISILMSYGIYLVFSYSRPINNIILNVMQGVSISFYDIYDIFQFSIGFFNIFFGIFLIVKGYEDRWSKYLFIGFLITQFLGSINYLPLMLSLILGTFSFSQINNLLVPNYVIYTFLTILSPIVFQIYLIIMIIKLWKKINYLPYFFQFLSYLGLYYLIFFTNKLIYFISENLILGSVVNFSLGLPFELLYSFGILFGLSSFYYFQKNEEYEKEVLKIPLLPIICFGIFLIFQSICSFNVLDSIQVFIQILIEGMVFTLAFILCILKKNPGN